MENQVITHSTHQERVTVGDLKNEETCDVLEKLKDCNVSCSEDELEHGNGALNEVDNELEIWRKKRELKRALKKKIKDGNVELTSSSSSSSSSDSSDSDEEYSRRSSRASRAILPATPGSSRVGCDAATQINVGARVSRKRYRNLIKIVVFRFCYGVLKIKLNFLFSYQKNGPKTPRMD